jgi:arginase family enzyme
MEIRPWRIIKVPYGGGYCSLNINQPKRVGLAPDILQEEFKKQAIFMADNSNLEFPDWEDIMMDYCGKNGWRRWQEMDNILFEEALEIFRNSDKVLFIGGSHTITYTVFRALDQSFFDPHDIAKGLIVLDSHPDCCLKSEWPINSDWLRFLVERHYLKPAGILFIGTRQIEEDELKFLNKYQLKYYHISDIEPYALTNNLRLVADFERFRSLSSVHISVDIDVVSGAFVPSAGYPNPNGFTDREITSIVKQLKYSLPNLMSADLVEINPMNQWQRLLTPYDPTIDLGVKIIKEIVS